jgi:hypothetical protein
MKTRSLFAIIAALALSTTAALATIFTTNTTIAVGNTTYDGQPIIVSNCTLTVNGPHQFNSLLVTSNGVVTATADPTGTNSNGLALTILTDATVAPGGAIQADGQGGGAQQGPGAGGTLSCNWGAGGGGGHGGLGGAGNDGCGSVPGGAAYGSVLQPVTEGSGGGWAGGAGGGAIHLNVGGTLTVEGNFSANGLSAAWGYGGGGAGGSVWLTVGTLAGTGSIMANGGPSVAAYGGGGAGGRIAIYYTNNLFAGTLSAQGAAGNEGGGAGTVYTKASSAAVGSLLLDNGGTVGALTPLTAPEAFALTIGGQALVYPETNLTLLSLVVASNGTLLHLASQSGLNLVIQQDARVALGGAIQADGQGNGSDQGPGAGPSTSCNQWAGGGGGHGGLGGAGNNGCYSMSGGVAYDSVLQPTLKGSGGGGYTGGSGGAGGGAICVNVGGTLTVEGQISANGLTASASGGGGSGGSLWLTAGTLAGTGSILVNGGAGSGPGGGGAGGRLAIYYASNLFTGTLTALGAAGYQNGGAGTIYTKVATAATGQVLVNNLGTNAAMTPLTAPEPFSLTITGLATAFPQTALVLGNLCLGTNATLTHLLTQSNMDLTVLQDVTIEAGGAIQADGLGCGAQQGPGAGGTLSCDWGAGGGGGHGGLGGAGNDGCSSVPGGAAYGSVLQPVTEGSGGGWSGGAGGGAIRLNVGGTLTVAGQISARGLPAAGGYGGGGAGGSIWLTVGTLAGTGVISANGGPSVSAFGGGGGGGRVAIYATNTTGNVIENVVLNGGTGCQPGALGTLQLQSSYLPLQGIGLAPASAVMSAVSNLDVFFNIAANPATVVPADVTITTPGGSIPASQITVEMLGGTELSLGFPPQNVPGTYQVQVGTQMQDLYGNSMTQAYKAAFVIAAPLISGTVCDTNGLPVAGVALQPGGGLNAVLTSTNGQYSLPVLASWTGTVTPSKPGWMFVPGAQAYTNLTANVTNQNYTLVETIVPALSSRGQGAGCLVQWYGLGGLGYQAQSSTDLVNWADYGSPQNGTNGPLWFNVPTTSAPRMFFRLQLLGN